MAKMMITTGTTGIGDGMTICRHSDREAYTVKKITATTIILQRDKATRVTKPVMIVGGFSAHCTNNNEIEYTYESDDQGHTVRAYWSKNDNCFKVNSCRVIPGRHEFYDYNF